MINFAEYDDEKLGLWIRTYELCPSTHCINEENYKEAKKEQKRRIRETLRGQKLDTLMID